MHSEGGAAHCGAAAAAVEEVRCPSETFPAFRSNSMDETGLLYGCLLSQMCVCPKYGRRARGTKAMRHICRVTRFLCQNKKGTQTLSMDMICEATMPISSRGDGKECSLPYST